MTKRTPLFRSLLVLLLVALLPATASAQDDAPLPYPGQDDDGPRSRRGRDDASRDDDSRNVPIRTRRLRERAVDSEELASLDDPNVGLGAELLGGLLLVDASDGAFANARPTMGARVVWEFGRALGGERWREHFFVDITGYRASLGAGTLQVQSHLTLMNLTVAPAFNLPFGQSGLSAYLQLGGGVSYQNSALDVNTVRYSVSALKPLIQYGLGFRGAFPVSRGGGFRITGRVEAMRLRRDYFDDYLFAGSLGFAF